MTEQDSSDSGTPTYFWQYDSSSVNGSAIINPVGHVVYSGTAFSYGGNSPQLLTTTTNTKFDAMGRIWNQQVCTLLTCHGSIPSYSLAYSYDLAGNQTNYSPDPQLVINQGYDSAGRPSSVTSTNTFGYGANIWTANIYGPVGLVKATFGNGIGEVLQYDNRLRLSSTYVCGPPCSQPLYSTSLAFYANGTISFNNDSINGSLYFSYDNLNRLLTVRPKAGPYNGMDLNEIYDSFGNRNQSMYVGGVLQPGASYSFTSANQISGFCYDAAGNLQDYKACPTNGSPHLYSYYGDGKLKSPDSGITTYIYDAEGRRVIESTSNSSSSSFDYIYNTNGTAMAITSYPQHSTAIHWLNFPVYGGGGRQLAIFGADTIHYDHLDWLHTLRAQTDVSGVVFQTFMNFPFGDNMLYGNSNASFTGKEFHFTGKERDAESGLDHFLFRNYSSSMGRWMSPDPAGMAAADLSFPQTLNRYTYVNNNPLSFTDPLGLDCAYLNDAGNGLQSFDQNSSSGECGRSGGYWVDGGLTNISINADAGTVQLTGTTNGTDQTSAFYQDTTAYVTDWHNTWTNPFNHVGISLAGKWPVGQNPKSDAAFQFGLLFNMGSGPGGALQSLTNTSVKGAIKPENRTGTLVKFAAIPVTGMQAQMIQNSINQAMQNPPNYSIMGGLDCSTWVQQVLGNAGINTGPAAPFPADLMNNLGSMYPVYPGHP